jgi:hypothetical protein
MKINLNVTNKNIKDAKIADPSNCPIAKALKRKVKGLTNVYVYGKDAHLVIKKGNRNYRYNTHLARVASKFVARFDAGLAVIPFKFSLNLKRASALV